MAWTSTNPVTIGNPTKKDDYDKLWDNVAMLADFASLQTSQAQGDIIYFDGSNYVRLGIGTSGYYLKSQGAGAYPVWGPITAASVANTMLKVASGEYGGHTANGISANYTLAASTSYGFMPKLKLYSAIGNLGSYSYWSYGDIGTTYILTIYLYNKSDESADIGMYANITYVTASSKEHWLFLIVEKETGKIIHAASAPDHPSSGNEGDHLAIPHPFADYYKKPLPEGLEIVLLDLEDTMKIKDMGLVKISDEIIIDMAREEIFKPRDMDGKRILTEKHKSYTVRKIRS